MAEKLEVSELQYSGLSEHDTLMAAALLSRLPPGRQPLPIFTQIARIRRLPSTELVVFEPDKSRPRVLLTRRKPDDPFWPNSWHIPGVVHDAADPGLDDVLDRLVRAEFEGLETTPPALFKRYFRTTERGPEDITAYLARAIGEPAVGQYFKVDELPEDIIKAHPPLIYEASEALRLPPPLC